MLLLALLALALAGCMLISGETTTVDLVAGSGNLSTTFVSAEGETERALELGQPELELQVIAMVAVASGDLELALLQPDGAVAFVVASRPDTQVTRSGRVRADAAGRLRYRVSARGARDGAVQLFVAP